MTDEDITEAPALGSGVVVIPATGPRWFGHVIALRHQTFMVEDLQGNQYEIPAGEISPIGNQS